MVPGWGMGGGGAPAFTPTKELQKRKVYTKRAKFFLQTLEYEQMAKRHEERAGKIPEFRVGDVMELTMVRANITHVESYPSPALSLVPIQLSTRWKQSRERRETASSTDAIDFVSAYP